MSYEYSELGKEFRRRRLKIVNVAKVFGGFLILLLFIELLGILVGNLSSKPVVAGWGTMEKGFWTEALFLRDETLLIAPTNGDLTVKQIDGARVPQGEVAATITTNDLEKSPVRIADLQMQFEQLTREANSLKADQQRVVLELTAQRDKLSHTPKKSPKFKQLKEDLNVIEQENASILRNIEINRLEIQSTARKINNNHNGMAVLSVDKPGYLFYKYDEWEEQLSPDQFTSLTTMDFKRDYALKSPSKQVETGMIIGKVINPFHQIISIIVDPKQTGIPVTGSLWWLKSGKNTFQCQIVNQTQLTDRRIILALDDVSMLPEFMPQRRAKVFIIFRRTSGITIPVQALYKKDLKMVVKVVKGDEYEETQVVVRENDGVKAIVDGIKFGTTIISR